MSHDVAVVSGGDASVGWFAMSYQTFVRIAAFVLAAGAVAAAAIPGGQAIGIALGAAAALAAAESPGRPNGPKP